MLDILILFLGFCFMILGIIGSFLPILPGPLTGWVGLLLLHLTKAVPKDWTFLGITLGIAITIYVLDFFIPAMGTKRYGGSKYGVRGSTIGLFVGAFFFPPLGIMIGPFAGAYIGELMYDSNDSKRALRAAYGAFLGFLFSTGLKFMTSLIYLGLYLYIAWEYKSAIF